MGSVSHGDANKQIGAALINPLYIDGHVDVARRSDFTSGSGWCTPSNRLWSHD